jgi:predicted enzyme related to lactoylglutathione lyase
MGKPITHLELASKNLGETKKFYSKLFGWKFEMFGDGYAMFKASQKGLAGGGFQLSKIVKPGTTNFYVEVESIPKIQQKATGLGGRAMKRKKAIGGGMGYWGTIRDPHGNTVGLWSKR